MIDYKGISGRISNLIYGAKLSHADFMKKIAIQSGTFYRYMNGDSKWPLELLYIIAKYFDVNLDYLIFGPKLDDKGSHVVKKNIYKLQEEIESLREENQKLKAALSPQMVATILSQKTKKKRPQQ